MAAFLFGFQERPLGSVVLNLPSFARFTWEPNDVSEIIPGALGTLLVLLALFALNLLPVRYTSLMLLLAAFALMILEAKFASHGVLAAAGIICLVFGTLTLVAGPIPELRVSVATAIGTGIAFGAITTFLVRIAFRARRNKVLTGPEALIGSIAIAQQPLDPRGQVMVHGELWFAESPALVSPGERVRQRRHRRCDRRRVPRDSARLRLPHADHAGAPSRRGVV